MTSLTREEIDQRTRDILRTLESRGNSYVKLARIRKEFDVEISHQALRPTVDRLRDDGELEPWQEEIPSTKTTYKITLDYECGLCEMDHDSRGDALRCCGDRFDDRAVDAVTGVSTVSGPVPNALERLKEAGQR